MTFLTIITFVKHKDGTLYHTGLRIAKHIPTKGRQQQDMKTVMICDDEQDILTTYKMALQPTYDVVTTSSGTECLAKYSEEKSKGHTIDALVLDYRLGDTSGDKVALTIKKMNGTKIILITAYELDRQMLDGLIRTNCIVKSLKKPLSPKRLREEITSVLLRSDKQETNATTTPTTLSPNDEGLKNMDAIMASLNDRLGEGTANLVFKTLKLVYKIDKDAARAQPELLKEKLIRILGEKVAKLVFDDAAKKRE